MSPGPQNAVEEFTAIVDALGDEPGVARPEAPDAGRQGFGASALRVDGRIFAMISRDRLVLKLPSHRVVELIGAGLGEPFDAGKGRPQKDWISLKPSGQEDALALAKDALAYVRAIR